MYPDVHLTRPWRRGIMVSLILTFFILAPALIFYTAGYRYNFATHQIEQTGVISIDAQPRDVEVTLDTITFEKKMPLRITNIRPGAYHLTMSKEGFHTWEKDIRVTSRQTTYIRDVLLPRIARPEPLIFEEWDEGQNIETVLPSPDGRYIIIVTTKQEMYEVFLFDTDRQRLTLLIRTLPQKLPIISWSPTGRVVFIGTKTESGTELRVLDMPDTNTFATATTTASLENIRYQWLKRVLGSPTLFFQEKNILYQLTQQGKRNIAVSTSTKWFVETEDSIWTTTDTPYLFLYDGKGNLRTSLPLPEIATDIVDITPAHFILQSERGIMVLRRNENLITDSQLLSVHTIRFFPQINTWIAWSSQEIWGIKDDGNAELLNRTGETIRTLTTFDTFGVLAVAMGQSLQVFNPGYFVSQELTRGWTIDVLHVNPKEQKIYFLSSDGEGKQRLYTLMY